MTRKQKYFLKQKLMGIAMVILSVIASITLLEGDLTILMVTIPLGLMLTLSKEMWIADEYYYEVENGEL